MAKPLVADLRAKLNDPKSIKRDGFSVLATITTLVNEEGDKPEIQDLVLRALDQRQHFGPAAEILDALIRKQGLYPYLEPDELGLADRVSYELHRPDNLDDIVFHRVQAQVYRLLLKGQSVVLSAPTSFGKSLIIDAMAACGRFKNIVVIVPTIALIDETRRRLLERFKGIYKIITHPTQISATRNIYILTQERAIDFPGLTDIDFLVVDEFYKLDHRKQDSERSLLLNQAFYKLCTPGTQFYLLGPNIRDISELFQERFKCTFVRTDYSTVSCEMKRVQVTKADRLDKLVGLCKGLNEPTLIYCSSPPSARKVAAALQENGIGRRDPRLADAVAWIGAEYHHDWILPRALQDGIGIHHGKVPRALSQFVVRAFNSGLLRFLVCTSTLIEGVNTKAKNVIIYDNKVAKRKLDFFTFNNIVGRSGRMLQHFTGRVFAFDEPPKEDFPFVQIPLVDQNREVPDSLLIQLREPDLTPESQERLEKLLRQKDLPISILRANHGIDPQAQIDLAKELAKNVSKHNPLLSWKGLPTYDQLEAACNLIWEFWSKKKGLQSGVSSGKQLTFLINRFRSNPHVQALIQEELKRCNPDEAVERSLDFLRHWAEFAFPRYLMALSRIQEFVFQRLGRPTGDYSSFAALTENHFAPAGIAALDEYGIPLQIGLKLRRHLGTCTDLDETLAALRGFDPSSIALSRFERQIVEETRSYI